MVGWPSGSGGTTYGSCHQRSSQAPVDQREHGAGNHGDVGASHDFEQAQCVRHFFVAPLISANHSDAQDLDLRRLDHHRHGLQVAAAGTGTILIDNHFVAGLSERKGGRYQKTRCEKDCSIPHGHLIGQLYKVRSDDLFFPGIPCAFLQIISTKFKAD